MPLPRKEKDLDKEVEHEGNAQSSLPSRGECEENAQTPHQLPQKSARLV